MVELVSNICIWLHLGSGAHGRGKRNNNGMVIEMYLIAPAYPLFDFYYANSVHGKERPQSCHLNVVVSH
jgi:hypothetical protein